PAGQGQGPHRGLLQEVRRQGRQIVRCSATVGSQGRGRFFPGRRRPPSFIIPTVLPRIGAGGRQGWRPQSSYQGRAPPPRGPRRPRGRPPPIPCEVSHARPPHAPGPAPVRLRRLGRGYYHPQRGCIKGGRRQRRRQGGGVHRRGRQEGDQAAGGR